MQEHMAVSGLLNVYKPKGLTSRDCVDRVERLVRPVKAGHAGTLDPLATGVLVICVGQATRLVEYIQRMPKEYRATFLLGQRSETDDVEGEVHEAIDARAPSRNHIELVLPRFLGEIQQVPPAHSAVKVAGRRAYKLARAGKSVPLKARPVTIHTLTIRGYEYPRLEIDIVCGSGTYVRSLGRDLAAALGTCAVMSALKRTAVGRFRVEGAKAVDDLTPETLSIWMQSSIAALPEMGQVVLSDAAIDEVRHGRPISTTADYDLNRGTSTGNELAAVDSAGQLIAILYEKIPGELWPARNFA
jgi:tRNA pseudouridine55 synthase